MKKEDYLKNQEIKYKLGVIDRRQFITSAIATVVAVPAALGLANQLQDYCLEIAALKNLHGLSAFRI